MRRLRRTTRASRAARYSETLEIERNQQRIAVDPVETNVSGVRHAWRTRAIDARIRDAIQNALLQPIAQGALTSILGIALIGDPLRGPRQRHRARDILRARAPLALMASAVHHRLERCSLANVQ